MSSNEDTVVSEFFGELIVKDLIAALLYAKKKRIEVQLLTAATPPAGNPPNITGVIVEVKKGIIKLSLTRGAPNRIGVFAIPHIIGFVPVADDKEITT